MWYPVPIATNETAVIGGSGAFPRGGSNRSSQPGGSVPDPATLLVGSPPIRMPPPCAASGAAATSGIRRNCILDFRIVIILAWGVRLNGESIDNASGVEVLLEPLDQAAVDVLGRLRNLLSHHRPAATRAHEEPGWLDRS